MMSRSDSSQVETTEVKKLDSPLPERYASVDERAASRPRPGWLRSAGSNLAKKLHDNEVALSFAVRAFRALQRIGISVSPNHYYWPIPDIAVLEGREWPSHALPTGVDLHLDHQLEFLTSVVPAYREEFAAFANPSDPLHYHYNNGYFEAVDAEIAYCIVRRFKPSRIIEVGGGFSTRVLTAALKKNLELDGVHAKLITIEPYPDRGLEGKLWDRMQLIPKRIQDVDLELFSCLGENDILFLDSSHVVSVGSDAVREYLEIIPRLNKGVIVHSHDIFIPSDYPRKNVMEKLTFWSEQYLLQAFLAFNKSFDVLWGSSAMQAFYPEVLESTFPQWKDSYEKIPAARRHFVPTTDGNKVWPSSFWFRRVS